MFLINLMLFLKVQKGFDEDFITKNNKEIHFLLIDWFILLLHFLL
jgi:hypothetical protein